MIRADDTGIRVLDRDDPRGVKKGHIWGYVGDGGLVAFDYTEDWTATGPANFVRRFRGFLQGDGYAGFDRALRPPADEGEVVVVVAEDRRLGCGMHYPARIVIPGSLQDRLARVGGPAGRVVIIRAESEGGKERDQVRRRAPSAGALSCEAGASPERVEYVALHLHIRTQVRAGRRDARVTEVVADDRDIHAGLKKRHGAAVTENRRETSRSCRIT